MTRITLFTHEFPPLLLSGVGNTVRFLSRELVSHGLDVTAVSIKFGKYRGLKSHAVENGVDVHRVSLPFYERLVFSAYGGMFSWLNPGISKADIIHALDSRDAPFIYKGSPMIVNVNDFVLANTPYNPFSFPYRAFDKTKRYFYVHTARAVERFSLRRADLVVPNSEYTMGCIRRAYKVPQKKIRLVKKGIDPSEFPEPGKRKGNRVLLVGGNLQMKGGEDVIKAMSEVVKKHPKTELTMVGKGDPINNRVLERMVRKYGLEKNIKFIRHIPHDELVRSYPSYDIFLLPSYMDSLPQVMLEAMASKMPVIGSTFGGIPEAVDDGRTGFLVEAGDIGGIADRLIRLLDDPKLRKEMGEKGYEKVCREFSFRRMVKDYIRLYDKLI